MLSDELYRSARWLRVLTARPVPIERRQVLALAQLPESEVRRRVANADPLLGR
jgi:hypothetical protein